VVPTVLLVRHAQASYGAADYDVLSALGHTRTNALVAALGRRGRLPERVLSGDLRRQRDTAAPVAAAAGVGPEVDPRWNEYDDADVLRHHTSSDARVHRIPGDETPPLSSGEFQTIVDQGLRAWTAAGSSSPCRQPWPHFSSTVTAALEDLARSLSAGRTALVVSSSGAIAAVAVALLGLPAEALVAFNHVSVNTAITKVIVGRGGISLVSFNEHGHLEETGGSLITYR
jgi:broad specificity phosphatase PhoE